MMFKDKNKLLTLISTHVLVCAFSISEESHAMAVDYSQQEYSSLYNNQFTNTSTVNIPSIQSYTSLISNNSYFVSLLVALALYKSFYPTSTGIIGKTIVWIISLIIAIPFTILIVKLFLDLLLGLLVVSAL